MILKLLFSAIEIACWYGFTALERERAYKGWKAREKGARKESDKAVHDNDERPARSGHRPRGT